MRYILRVLRSDDEKNHFFQNIPFESGSENDTVATALTRINAGEAYLDEDGKEVSEIAWECSCLQKKCGACAMVINGRPCLACDARFSDMRSPVVMVEPLRKFPLIKDLTVDRSILFENLRTMHVWLKDNALLDGGNYEKAFEASRCLQCGCCLEVCPNFYAGGKFFGTASLLPAARLLSEMPEAEANEIKRQYRDHFYAGCGKSLACRDICPAGIDVEDLLVRSNAASVWRRSFFGARREKGK